MPPSGLTEKTLSLLKALNTRKINSLNQLSQDINQPKPSVHRLLKTLIECGLVVRHPDTHYYSITSHCADLSRGVDRELEYVETLAPIARQLTADTGWPIAFATLDGDSMLIRFSSRPDARFSFIKSTVGKRFPLFGSALGEAWLGHCSQGRQRLLLKEVEPARLQRRLRQLGQLQVKDYLDQVREQGYALRYGRSGESSHLAVPVMDRRRVLGCLGISVFATAVGKNIVPLYLKLLQQAAEEVRLKMAEQKH